MVRRDGAMVLTDVDDTIVWQTSTTATDASIVELLNTGNLVMKNSIGEILWESFDYPTDTLLPSQVFTKGIRLTSVLRMGSFGSGYFNLYFGTDNVLRLICDTPEISTTYWPNPDYSVYQNGRTNYNSSRIAVLDDMGRFRSSDLLSVNDSYIGYGIKRRLAMDYDGNLRIYCLNSSTELWAVTWQAIIQPCKVSGICGRIGICVYAPVPKCTCPPGFELKNQNNWNAGCRATFEEALLRSKDVQFLEIPHTDYYGFDLSTLYPVTLEGCRDLCLQDFSCLAFSYRLLGQGYCFLKSDLFNGYASPDFVSSIYIKLPVSVTASKPDIFHSSSLITCDNEDEILEGSPFMYDFNNKKVRWVYGYSFVAALGVTEMMFVLVGWWFLFVKHSIPDSIEVGYHMISSQFRQYSYSELRKATKYFKEELGRGASGTVYKGILSDGRDVAVKRLGDAFQTQEEYFAEIRTLGRLNHMNLVRIFGFCSERKHRLLVYEYLGNSSLDKHLFHSKFLSWKQRYTVALGMAKGLAYLHHECLEWIIHCDVKPENILLDGEFHPKIADFGLAKLLQGEGPRSEFTRIRGTKGYMAPEWALNLPITAKVDVFGYGVVILEIVAGIRLCNWVVNNAGDDMQEAGHVNFLRKMKGMLHSGNLSWVESVVDPRLQGKFSRSQVLTLIITGISCMEEDRNKRPTMASVLQTLLDSEDGAEA